MNEVNKFIQRFHTSKDIDTVFASSACYWFAYILFRRFIHSGAVLMYSSVDNHFGTKICGKVYDITGDVSGKYAWTPWLEFGDETEKERIVCDCIMF